MKDTIFHDILRFITNRVFIVSLIVLFMFYLLAMKLFDLQIVNGETYQAQLSNTIAKTTTIPAQRGSIYDRFGRPLAVNQFGYTVQIDPSVSITSKDLNNVLFNLILLLEGNGEAFIDELRISETVPYEFTYYGENSQSQENRWKQSMDLDEGLTAQEAMEELSKRFTIAEDMPQVYARKIISLRAKLYGIRYYSFNPVTVALDVSVDTVTAIEEDAEKFKSVIIDTEPLRYYPAGEYISHVIGYMGTISADDGSVEELTEKGYSMTDSIGRTGLEAYFEDYLRGTAGTQTVIVNSAGRRVGVIDDDRIEPIQGDKVFISTDIKFQEECYNILVEMLKETIINKMTITSRTAEPITARGLLSSLVAGNNISAMEIFESDEDSYSYRLKAYVLSIDEAADPSTKDGRSSINAILSEGIEESKISTTDVLLCMYEQGIITADDTYLARIKSGAISSHSVILDKIRADEITPQMANVDPSTGSLVVVNVRTGSVLASPTYPTYDNNNFNALYQKLSEDPTTPMINRPFSERRAPGSTFKMISAVTGLETGSITPNTRIYDEVSFTKAGRPHLSCWNRSGHGSINVVTALEVSCNYFFCDTIYRIGNAKENNTLDAIHALNKYMVDFDLDKVTGVEISESAPIYASPEYKYDRNLNREGEHTEWFDGDSVQTSIGQSFNNYTSAAMAKYVATVATKGDKYDLHFMEQIISDKGYIAYEPVLKPLENEISDETWDILHSGMINVTEGTKGTARELFRNFPIRVGGKTGTAQESNLRADHTSFAGFAPFDDPQIAVYVSIPFSDTTTTTSPASQVGKKVIAAYFNLESEIESPLPENSIVK